MWQTACRTPSCGKTYSSPTHPLKKTLTAPDSDDDGGDPSGPGGGVDGGDAMDGGDGDPALDIEDMSIHSFDGHTGEVENREAGVCAGGPPPSRLRKKGKLMNKLFPSD